MKTSKLLLAGIVLAAFAFPSNAQSIVETSTLTSGGLNAGTTGTNNTYYGYNAGKVTTGAGNTFVGHISGQANVGGPANSFFGFNAGVANTTGGSNTALGWSAGSSNISGLGNLYVGAGAGYSNKTGSNNVYLGDHAGAMLPNYYNAGSNNVCIGSSAGFGNSGSGNIFLGTSSGFFSTGDNQLYIDNSDTATPLIYGDFNANLLQFNGRVAVGEGSSSFPSTAGGVSVSNYKLFVKGGILTEEIRVSLKSQWADYVFANDYALLPLKEVECFINENGHLPNVPSAKQVEADGIELAEMSNIQQEKIEELTLYAIEQNKKIEKLEQQLKELQELKAIVKELSTKK